MLPWTFEPMEMHAEKTWEIYDPNMARVVAVFHDKKAAKQYLKYLNGKQDKKRTAKRDNAIRSHQGDSSL